MESPRPSSLWPLLSSTASQFVPLFCLSLVSRNGSIFFDPALALLCTEAIKLATSIILARSQFPPQDDPEGDSTNSGRRGGYFKSKLVGQTGVLSLLYTLTSLFLVVASLLVPVSAISLLLTTSTIASGLLASCYLQAPLTPQQWLVGAIHSAGIVATQWHSCRDTALAPFWLYSLLFMASIVQQFCALWHQSLLRHSGAPPHVISALMATFGVGLGLWLTIWLPPDIWSPVPPDTRILSLPALAFIISSAVASLIHQRLLSHSSTSLPSAISPFITACLLYATSLFTDDEPYVTVSVVIGLLTVGAATFSFNAFSDDSIVRVQPGYRKSTDGTFSDSLLAVLPDFVTAHWSKKHALYIFGFVTIAFLLFQTAVWDSKEGPNLEQPLRAKGPPTLATTVQFPPNFPRDGRFSYSTNSVSYLDWLGRKEAENDETFELVDFYMAKRDQHEGDRHKSLAMCIVGNFGDGFANDLNWLHMLHKTVDSYDLFVWQGPDSLPYDTGFLHPKITSLVRHRGTPGGMHKRFRNRINDNDDFALHMWAYGYCADMIQQYRARTGTSYDWLMVSKPNATFVSPPMPHMSEWHKDSIHFSNKERFLDRVIWGPYELVANFTPRLHPAIMTYGAGKSLGDFPRQLAKLYGLSTWEPPH